MIEVLFLGGAASGPHLLEEGAPAEGLSLGNPRLQVRIIGASNGGLVIRSPDPTGFLLLTRRQLVEPVQVIVNGET